MKLPKWKIQDANLFGKMIELYGKNEGQYVRIDTPKWLLQILDRNFQDGRKSLQMEIHKLLNIEK